MNRIGSVKHRLQIFAWRVVELRGESPGTRGKKTPIAVETKREIQVSGRAAAADHGFGELEIRRANIPCRLQFRPNRACRSCVSIVCTWPTNVGPTSGPRMRPFQVALPVMRRGGLSRSADRVDEIVPVQQIIGPEFDFQGRIGGAEKTVHIQLHFGRCDFAVGDGHDAVSIGVVEIHLRRGGNSVRACSGRRSGGEDHRV